MASHQLLSEGASAPSNIVPLPTAATRKVDNFRFAEQRRAVVDARRETAHRFNFELPRERQRERGEQMMLGLERSPALFLAMALFKCADQSVKDQVCRWTAEAVDRDPDCLPTWQADQLAAMLSGAWKDRR